MNPDQYRQTIEQLAEVDWLNPKHPIVKKLLVSATTCNDCGRECVGQPTRTLFRNYNFWAERCTLCHLYRSDAGVFELKSRIQLKSASDSGSSPKKQSSHLSQPIAHVTSSCPDHHAVTADPVRDSVTESSVHQDPPLHDPVDHLVLDISIHKC
jgi:hypothetical protein